MNPIDPLALATDTRVTIALLEEEIRRLAPRAKRARRLLDDLRYRTGKMKQAIETQAETIRRLSEPGFVIKAPTPPPARRGRPAKIKGTTKAIPAAPPAAAPPIAAAAPEETPLEIVSRVISWPESTPLWERFKTSIEKKYLIVGQPYSGKLIRETLACARPTDEIRLSLSLHERETGYRLNFHDGRYYVDHVLETA